MDEINLEMVSKTMQHVSFRSSASERLSMMLFASKNISLSGFCFVSTPCKFSIKKKSVLIEFFQEGALSALDRRVRSHQIGGNIFCN